ncbi:MAG: thiamine biosynthesis protein [Planctomycetota bacterium]|nr:MAG: thiamine biosynthesis protein [Planctomycetota bacterium]
MQIVLHYAELGLKGKNRPYFEIRLAENAKRLLAPLGDLRIRRQPGRILLTLPDAAPWEEVRRRLSMTFGLSYFARIHVLKADMEALETLLATELPSMNVKSFACRCRRMNKDYPLTSEQMNRRLGAFVQKLIPGTTVDLDAPELEIFVEVVNKDFYAYFRREPGPGGLPAGTAGRVVTLLSGGIDSPVAAWRMIRRGCRTSFVHFHSMPFTSQASVDKVRELAQKLEPWQGPARLHLVPFAALQQEIVTSSPQEFRIILYRRFMTRIAAAIARREDAHALVTGDSLGQVASQTLTNLETINAVATIPVLRPLIGMDKQEIIDTARRIATFDVSNLPHDDCCSFLMPRAPATASSPEKAAEAEKGLEVDRLVKEALSKVVEERATA